MTPALTLRQRLVRGVQAQVFGHAVRVAVQVGGVAVLTAVWGLDLYGEWLILAALPTYLSYSDIGLLAAANNEMIMSVGRNDRAAALVVFQVATRTVAVVFGVLVVALPVVAALMPVAGALNLSVLGETQATWVLLLLALDFLVMILASPLYGGFACEGYYGAGGAWLAGLNLIEFAALAGVVIAGGQPALAAGAMLAARSAGTVAMFFAMRRRAPWLRFGDPGGSLRVLRRLLSPSLASAAFPLGFVLNLQGMILVVGIVASPASAAVFSTLRTMSRAVIQLLASVFAVIAPEISKAYAQGDETLLRTLHRRGCQAAVWIAAPILVVLALFGEPIVSLWTSGQVDEGGSLLYLFLAVAGIDSLWYTSLAVMFATNRHQRLAVAYVLASLITLPLAWVLLEAIGLSGAALALVALEVFMAVVVLRQVLPATHDSLRGWLGSLVRPPRFLFTGGKLAAPTLSR